MLAKDCTGEKPTYTTIVEVHRKETSVVFLLLFLVLFYPILSNFQGYLKDQNTQNLDNNIYFYKTMQTMCTVSG